MVGFDGFWAAWPKNSCSYTRKGAKAACLKLWITRHHETQAGTILAHVRWLSTTADWLKDGGAFIPAPLVYLHQQRWDGADIPAAPEVVAADHAAIYQRHLANSIAAMKTVAKVQA